MGTRRTDSSQHIGLIWSVNSEQRSQAGPKRSASEMMTKITVIFVGLEPKPCLPIDGKDLKLASPAENGKLTDFIGGCHRNRREVDFCGSD